MKLTSAYTVSDTAWAGKKERKKERKNREGPGAEKQNLGGRKSEREKIIHCVAKNITDRHFTWSHMG